VRDISSLYESYDYYGAYRQADLTDVTVVGRFRLAWAAVAQVGAVGDTYGLVLYSA